jgi:hypothetical protein
LCCVSVLLVHGGIAFSLTKSHYLKQTGHCEPVE